MGLRAAKLSGFKPTDANDAGAGIDLKFWFAVDFPDNLFDATPAFSQFTDHGSLGGDAVNAVAGERPLRVSSNGRLAAQFDNTDDNLVSDIAASNYNFMHDGTGATIFAVARRSVNDGSNHNIFDTFRSVDTNTGISVRQSATGSSYFVRVGNSSGTFVIDSQAAGFPEDSLAHIMVLRWDAAAFDIRVDGTSIASGAPVGAPDAGNPFATLNIGRRAGGGVELRGDFLEGGGYTGELPLSDVERLETYLSRWAG